MKIQHKPYTIHQLSADKSPSVYVLNTSDQYNMVDDKPIRGDIYIPIKTQTGESVLLVVPATWIPIDLSTFADKEDILRSTRFRHMHRTHQIELISPEEAEKALMTKDALREQDFINKTSLTKFTTNVMSGEMTEQERESGLVKAEGDYEKLKISSFIADIFGRDDLTDDDRYAMVNSKSESMTKEDWNYILEYSSSEDLKDLALKHVVD